MLAAMTHPSSAEFGHESKALYAKELYLTADIYIYISLHHSEN